MELGKASGITGCSRAVGLLGDAVEDTAVHRPVSYWEPEGEGNGSAVPPRTGVSSLLVRRGAGRAGTCGTTQPAQPAELRRGRAPLAEEEKGRGRDKALLSLWQLPGSCTADGEKGRGEKEARKARPGKRSREKPTPKGEAEVGEEQRSPGASKGLRAGVQGGGS